MNTKEFLLGILARVSHVLIANFVCFSKNSTVFTGNFSPSTIVVVVSADLITSLPLSRFANFKLT